MDELTFAPSKKSLSMDSFWCDEMAVSGTAAALERRLRKRTIVLRTKAGDPDVDVLAARLESRRFSCVTARRIFKVRCFLLLLLKSVGASMSKKLVVVVVVVDIFQKRELDIKNHKTTLINFFGFL